MYKKNAMFMQSLKSACRGIVYTLKTEKHMRFHFFVALLVIILGFTLRITQVHWLFIVYAIGSVLVSELINTSLERAIDLAKPSVHPLAGLAKDIAAGAVLIAAIQAVIIGCVVFSSYLF
ncbi:MAG: diacylglycerol kinase family protein [Peptococcaceae bacterium]|jgi:diacylglycerol kinase|nr:diacylglycerol kinase family protein [Peptococcaceae bacterium]